MTKRFARWDASNADQSTTMFFDPALALSTWNPFLAAALKGNAQAQEGFGTIASEWQDFVARRLKEDFALFERLAQSYSPDQFMAAYGDFWQNAAEDYGDEFTTMSKLMTGTTTKMVTAAQSATSEAVEASTNAFQSRKAA